MSKVSIHFLFRDLVRAIEALNLGTLAVVVLLGCQGELPHT